MFAVVYFLTEVPLLLAAVAAKASSPWVLRRVRRGETVVISRVDDRVAPAGHPDRNLTHLRDSLLERVPLRPEQVCAMPVESPDLEAAAVLYARMLQQIAGSPPLLDVVHLGLGPDGHTASLVPGDPVLEITDADVPLTQPYQQRRRMTLTYPTLNRARRILWVVTGTEKAGMLVRLRDGDVSIPAGRVRRDQALVLAGRRFRGIPEKPLRGTPARPGCADRGAGGEVRGGAPRPGFPQRPGRFRRC